MYIYIYIYIYLVEEAQPLVLRLFARNVTIVSATVIVSSMIISSSGSGGFISIWYMYYQFNA